MPGWAQTFFSFNSATTPPIIASYTFDINISESYPGVQFNGQEANALFIAEREVAGAFWTVQNADWNAAGTNWIPKNVALPAFAYVMNADGSFHIFKSAAGVNPCVWTEYGPTNGTANVPGDGSSTVAVAFGTAYASIPLITATVVDGATPSGNAVGVHVFNKSTTGFSLVCFGGPVANVEVDWRAAVTG